MKTILKKWQMLLMLVLTLGITACSDDTAVMGITAMMMEII